MHRYKFWTGLVAISALMIVVPLTETFLNRGVPICETLQDTLDIFEQQMIGALIKLNDILISTVFVVFGGIGATLARGCDEANKYKLLWLWLLIAASLLAALSLYYGYIGEIRLLEMLSGRCFTLDSPVLKWPSFIQFYTLEGAVLLLLSSLLVSSLYRQNG